MAYLNEVAGGCGDAGCTRPVKYALFTKDHKKAGKYCKTCAERRLGLLEKIEQRLENEKRKANRNHTGETTDEQKH